MELKKRSILLILAIVMATMMCSCSSNTYNTATKVKKARGEESIVYGSFVQIPGEEENGLYYHKKSRTVYVIFDKMVGYDSGILSATPYIDDGHYFEYVDGEIVPDKNTAITSETNIEETSDEIWASLTDEEKAALLEQKGY